jgi:hypothetical protein
MPVKGEHHVGKEEEVSGYELLRGRAAGAAEENGEGHGWSLLVSRGMLAWLRAFSSYVPVGARSERRRESGMDGEFPVLGAEMVQVLTNMVLASRS